MPTRRPLGKAIARGSRKKLITECMRGIATRKYLNASMSRILHKEIRKLCSTAAKCVLNPEHSNCSLQDFTWDRLLEDIAANAPMLLAFLQACTRTRKPRTNRKATIGMCITILLKFRFNKMCLVQKMIAVILYAGHSGK